MSVCQKCKQWEDAMREHQRMYNIQGELMNQYRAENTLLSQALPIDKVRKITNQVWSPKAPTPITEGNKKGDKK
jgi:ornithine carbamoyltransferase